MSSIYNNTPLINEAIQKANALPDKPSGKLNITDTAVKDVTNYAQAQVVDANLVADNIKKDVTILGITGTHEGGATPVLIEKSITQNGTYNASDDDADGYSKVTVAVSGGGGATVVEEENEFGGITMTITE